MEKSTIQNDKFHLSRKLVIVVSLFIMGASILVVLTNFSLNMMAVSRGYTDYLSTLSNHYQTSQLLLEKYGSSGKTTAYQQFRTAETKVERLSDAMDELFQSDPNIGLIIDTYKSEHAHPTEISTLLAVYRLFKETSVIREIHRRWQQLKNIDRIHGKVERSIHREWLKTNPSQKRINKYLSKNYMLNQRWNRKYQQLMTEVDQASLAIKRFGLWLVVILGILLVLIGVVVAARASKSIKKWERNLREKEVLLTEIHHRVKNNLAVVSGLLELEGMKDDNSEKILQVSRDRIQSMATIHEMLYQSDSFSEIKLHQYIDQLTSYIQNTHVGDNQEFTIETALDPVVLNINQAVPLGLLLNELIVNSIEHSTKSGSKGGISIGVRENSSHVILELQETSIGLYEYFKSESSKFMNMEIVNALVEQLDADMKVSKEGRVDFILSFPKSDASGSSNSSF